MKTKIYILIIALILCSNHFLRAQNIYTFSHSTPGYTALINPTVVVNNSGFSGFNYNLALGFNFLYWGLSSSTFIYSTDAYCTFSNGSYGFYPFFSNLKGLGNSHVAVEISGTPGSKIAKVEWKDVGFMNDNSNTDSVSFQIWLYETSNKIEIHFGNWAVQTSHFTSVFGNAFGNEVALASPSGNSFYNLQGNPASPSFVYMPSTFLYLNGYPSDGTVYTFSPTAPAVQPVSVFSCPASGCVGDTLTMSNNSTGTPVPTYSWSATPATGVTFSPSSTFSVPQVVFTNAGNYTITCLATNSAGNSTSNKTLNIDKCNTVGLNEKKLSGNYFNVLPNPSKGVFYLQTSFTDFKLLRVDVVNAVGQFISKPDLLYQKDNSIRFDLSNQSKGIYTILISNGREILSKRIVIDN